MFKRNAEIKCYQAVFAFLFLNLLFCNVVRMSFGVRGVRAALSIVFFGVTIRKTRILRIVRHLSFLSFKLPLL